MDKLKFIKESLENDLDYWESGATASLRALREKIKFILEEKETKNEINNSK